MARKSNSRAARLDRALDMLRENLRSNIETAISDAVEDSKGDIEELKEEIGNWREGLEGTNLENSSKYQELEECENALDDILSELDQISADEIISDLDSVVPDAGNVSFPSMY